MSTKSWKFGFAATGLFIVGVLATGCNRRLPVEEVRPLQSVIDETWEPATPPADTDWPSWRGTKGDGKAIGTAPTKWSPKENIAWSVEVPGKGHSSPILWQGKLFLASADVRAETLSLLCYDRQDGEPKWTCVLHQGGIMHAHDKNTHASATPACDGQKIYWAGMVSGGIWVSAVDLDGKIAWQTEAGPFQSKHGYGSSPVLYKNLVIVAGDSDGPGFLAALDKQTGKIAWRVQRGNVASFGTPVIAEVAGKTQLLLSGQSKMTSYDPATGDELWQSAGPASVTANTVVWNDDLIFAQRRLSRTNNHGYPGRRQRRGCLERAAEGVRSLAPHRWRALAGRAGYRHTALLGRDDRQADLEQTARRGHHILAGAQQMETSTLLTKTERPSSSKWGRNTSPLPRTTWASAVTPPPLSVAARSICGRTTGCTVFDRSVLGSRFVQGGGKDGRHFQP